MLTLFKIHIKKEQDSGGNHVTGFFSPYDLAITADDETELAEAMYDQLAKESIEKKDFNNRLLEDKTEGDDLETLYLYIDVEREFRIRKNTTVRKNISLPEWMDVRLRETGIDASKLFQNAAIACIEKYANEKEKNTHEN